MGVKTILFQASFPGPWLVESLKSQAYLRCSNGNTQSDVSKKGGGRGQWDLGQLDSSTPLGRLCKQSWPVLACRQQLQVTSIGTTGLILSCLRVTLRVRWEVARFHSAIGSAMQCHAGPGGDGVGRLPTPPTPLKSILLWQGAACPRLCHPCSCGELPSNPSHTSTCSCPKPPSQPPLPTFITAPETHFLYHFALKQRPAPKRPYAAAPPLLHTITLSLRAFLRGAAISHCNSGVGRSGAGPRGQSRNV